MISFWIRWSAALSMVLLVSGLMFAKWAGWM